MVTNCPYCSLDTGGNHQTGCPNNPIKVKGVDWFSHSDALVVGPTLEKKISEIRDVLLEYQNNKIGDYACIAIIALKVLSTAEYDLFTRSIYAEQIKKWSEECGKESTKKTAPEWDELYK